MNSTVKTVNEIDVSGFDSISTDPKYKEIAERLDLDIDVPDFDLTSKSQIIRKVVDYELYELDEGQKARLTLFQGKQGSGKSSGIIDMMMKRAYGEGRKKINDTKTDVVIWRFRNRDEIRKVPNFEQRCVFWHHHNDEMIIKNVRGDVSEVYNDNLRIRRYYGSKDFLKRAEKGKINVVLEPSIFRFDRDINIPHEVAVKEADPKIEKALLNTPQFGVYFWFELFYLLVNKEDTFWYMVVIDELAKLFPAGVKKPRHYIHEWVRDVWVDLRKSRVDVLAASHKPRDIDYRLRDQFQNVMYMMGSRVGKESQIKQNKVNWLHAGEFYADCGLFAKFKSKYFPEPEHVGDLVVIQKFKGLEGC